MIQGAMWNLVRNCCWVANQGIIERVKILYFVKQTDNGRFQIPFNAYVSIIYCYIHFCTLADNRPSLKISSKRVLGTYSHAHKLNVAILRTNCHEHKLNVLRLRMNCHEPPVPHVVTTALYKRLDSASIIWAPPEIEVGSYVHLRPKL